MRPRRPADRPTGRPSVGPTERPGGRCLGLLMPLPAALLLPNTACHTAIARHTAAVLLLPPATLLLHACLLVTPARGMLTPDTPSTRTHGPGVCVRPFLVAWPLSTTATLCANSRRPS